ncbi:hypothetical protein Acsp01_77060 [Actinoplanes sp. NBRC 101535]|nr:hypothetical protein Acsp01_77060 [Actinoplanes sp. NBRC 101535]
MQGAAGTIADRSYTYDDSGQITSISDTPGIGEAETQCFTHDHLQRLTSAWTPKAGVDCETVPSVANLGGPAAYWTDWTFDNLGNRTKEVTHGSAGDTTRAYAVPTAGAGVVRPHAVTGMTTTQADQSSVTVGYTYDDTGNTLTRPGDTATQTLTWNAEGKAVKSVEGSKVTTSLYDADGTRLIRRDNDGATLYLPGMEVRRASTATIVNSGTRYYSFGGGTIASRTQATASLAWLFADHQGTQQLTVNASTLQHTVRRQTPYGGPRGVNPMWPNSKGFVGGDLDPTGLIHIGAREYDSALGRFVSVDPVQDLTDPQQWNAYVYANNSPITSSDPTGMLVDVGNGIIYNPYTGKTTGGSTTKTTTPKTTTTTSGNAVQLGGWLMRQGSSVTTLMLVVAL